MSWERAMPADWKPSSPNGTDAEWEDPLPLIEARALPTFPVEAYPPVLAEYVTALATATQTPPDLSGVMVLSALSAAAGGRAVVEARPSWREPMNLFLGVAMAPGNRKTAVVRDVTEPLHQAESIEIERRTKEIAQKKAEKEIAEQRAAEAKRVAARAERGDADKAKDEAVATAAMAEAITVPAMPRLLADDVTPEALASLLADQGGPIALISAEGGPFDVMAGRYSNLPNLDVYLKGHAGDHLRVDRKGRPSEIVDKPALTIGVAFQPGILPKIAMREGFRSRGLLARFLFSVPRSYVGKRKVGAPPVNNETRSRYNELVKEMVVSLAEGVEPCVLTLDDHAEVALLHYERALEPRLAPQGDLGSIADWGSKLAGAVVRIAGLLHLAGGLTTALLAPIDEATLIAATKIGDYFLAHAIAAYGLMGADPASMDAFALLEWIERGDKVSFSRRDAHYHNQARFPRVADLAPALDLLVAHGYIRPREQADQAGPGRPRSPVFDVNPTLTQMTKRQNSSPNGGSVVSVNCVNANEPVIDTNVDGEDQADPDFWVRFHQARADEVRRRRASA